MSDEIKEIKEIEKEIKPNEILDKAIEKIKEDHGDIFITDESFFPLTVRYYKDGKNIVVEDIDSDFNKENKEIKSITINFKYPTFDSYKTIYNLADLNSEKEIKTPDLHMLQYYRLITLLKSWDIDKPMTEFEKLNTKIIKAFMTKMTAEIQFDGIL